MLQAGEALLEDDYLFRQPIKAPMVPTTFIFCFKEILQQNGLLETLNVHSLQHFFAYLLGHADTAFLARTYRHPQPLYKKVAADIFSSLMEPQNEAYKSTPPAKPVGCVSPMGMVPAKLFEGPQMGLPTAFLSRSSPLKAPLFMLWHSYCP